jgi:hypothetical protein
LYLGDIDVPGFAGASLVGACRFGARSIWRGQRWRCRHHLGAILGRRTEDAVVSDEVAARAGNQREQLLYQLVRREHDMGRAIAPGLPETQGKPAVGQFLQMVVRDGWSGKIAAQVLEAVAVIRAYANVRVNIETGDLRASFTYDRGLGILAGTSQTQYATASARTSRDQALHGGIGQMVEGQLLVLVFPREPPQVARDLPIAITWK